MIKKAFYMSVGMVVLSADILHAQAPRCGNRDIILEKLSSKYGESRQTIGLAANNGIFETFASEKTGTWTMLVTQPNGQSCLIASGQAFEVLGEKNIIEEDA